MFYTLTNLQGSQTCCPHITGGQTFYTLTNLQGSQTQRHITRFRDQFYTLTNLQGSQTELLEELSYNRFTLLQTYKVLKPQMRLSPSQNILVICVSHLVMYKTQIFIY